MTGLHPWRRIRCLEEVCSQLKFEEWVHHKKEQEGGAVISGRVDSLYQCSRGHCSKELPYVEGSASVEMCPE